MKNNAIGYMPDEIICKGGQTLTEEEKIEIDAEMEKKWGNNG
jgi:hypothetical protein